MKKPVYLDHNSTTPLDPSVFEAMKPFFMEEFGNPGSRTHLYGQRAKDAVDQARAEIANVLGKRPEEVVFTSGATESNNLAICGLARWGSRSGRKHLISTAIEHKAVIEPLAALRGDGFEVELVPVTPGGFVDPDEIRRRLRKDTLLVSVMHANNETGVLQPIEEIGDVIRSTDAFFHIDAAQTFGKEVERLRKVECDFISVSAHKIYGPKGIGALYARRLGAQRRPLTPLIMGGGQEWGLRSGTLPVPLIVGLGAASALALRDHVKRRKCAAAVRARLLEGLKRIDHKINGDERVVMPHVANVCFPGVDSEALMVGLRDVAALSNGSACTSSSYAPSHVLKAMGLSDDDVSSSVRISWGAGIAPADVPVDAIVETVESLRGIAK